MPTFDVEVNPEEAAKLLWDENTNPLTALNAAGRMLTVMADKGNRSPTRNEELIIRAAEITGQRAQLFSLTAIHACLCAIAMGLNTLIVQGSKGELADARPGDDEGGDDAPAGLAEALRDIVGASEPPPDVAARIKAEIAAQLGVDVEDVESGGGGVWSVNVIKARAAKRDRARAAAMPEDLKNGGGDGFEIPGTWNAPSHLAATFDVASADTPEDMNKAYVRAMAAKFGIPESYITVVIAKPTEGDTGVGGNG